MFSSSLLSVCFLLTDVATYCVTPGKVQDKIYNVGTLTLTVKLMPAMLVTSDLITAYHHSGLD